MIEKRDSPFTHPFPPLSFNYYCSLEKCAPRVIIGTDVAVTAPSQTFLTSPQSCARCCAVDVIMVLFVTVALGRCCAGPVERRSWLGVGGIVLVVAAGLAAYGLNSGFGKRARTIGRTRNLVVSFVRYQKALGSDSRWSVENEASIYLHDIGFICVILVLCRDQDVRYARQLLLFVRVLD